MDIGTTLGIIVSSALGLALLYSIYQLFRNEKVWKINENWFDTNDDRAITYSYDEMFDPNKSNWFGLRWPMEKHFYKRPRL